MVLDFDFLQSKDISEAVKILNKYEKIQLLAGGTDLIVDIKNESKRLSDFNYLLDISNIDELKIIKEDKNFIKIGAVVSLSDLINNNVIKARFPLLVKAARTIGSTQIRNRGTIGGNINNASPAADLIPPLMALDAEVFLRSSDNERKVRLLDYVSGPYQTVRKSNEIMLEVILPILTDNYYFAFGKIGRRKALNIARLNIALVAGIVKNKIIDIRVVPGAATPYPQRFSQVEEYLLHREISKIDFAELKLIAGKEMLFITGERWSTPYKKSAIGTLLERALKEVIEEANHHE